MGKVEGTYSPPAIIAYPVSWSRANVISDILGLYSAVEVMSSGCGKNNNHSLSTMQSPPLKFNIAFFQRKSQFSFNIRE